MWPSGAQARVKKKGKKRERKGKRELKYIFKIPGKLEPRFFPVYMGELERVRRSLSSNIFRGNIKNA